MRFKSELKTVLLGLVITDSVFIISTLILINMEKCLFRDSVLYLFHFFNNFIVEFLESFFGQAPIPIIVGLFIYWSFIGIGLSLLYIFIKLLWEKYKN